MSIKRAYQLNTGLIDSLHTAGSITNLKHTRMWCITINKDLRDAFNLGAYGKEDPAVHHQDVWEWVIDHWYGGGLKRSVDASMDNLTETNRSAIKGNIKKLYGEL